jgi:hypothetical protein
MRKDYDLNEVKQISILDYLSSRGFNIESKGSKLVCKSPFNRDTNWSCVIYPHTNSFYDWSAGFGGSIIDLVMAMDRCSVKDAIESLAQGNFQKYTPNYKSSKAITKKQFEYTRYLTTDPEEIKAIHAYAQSRKILGGFEYGVFFVHDNGSFQRKPSVMFLHRNAENQVVGAKFRDICPKDSSNRFSSRGEMQYYILEYVDIENFGPPTLYVVEGEANANSLWQYCQDIRKNAVVISFGGVGNLPASLPTKYLDIKDKRLIIDYDGSEDVYKERIEKYSDYGLNPLKLILDKGRDINSLYINNEMNLIKHLIL